MLSRSPQPQLISSRSSISFVRSQIFIPPIHPITLSSNQTRPDQPQGTQPIPSSPRPPTSSSRGILSTSRIPSSHRQLAIYRNQVIEIICGKDQDHSPYTRAGTHRRRVLVSETSPQAQTQNGGDVQCRPYAQPSSPNKTWLHHGRASRRCRSCHRRCAQTNWATADLDIQVPFKSPGALHGLPDLASFVLATSLHQCQKQLPRNRTNAHPTHPGHATATSHHNATTSQTIISNFSF